MKISIYTKRITEDLYQNMTFRKTIINFCMRASNLFLMELKFKCAITSLFKFILRITFKWLISLPLDLYSALKASNSPLGLRKI